MKCPMLSIACAASQMPVSKLADDCLFEDCAWWNEELKQCDPTGFLAYIIGLTGTLQGMADKMPHEEQFRR